MEMFLGHMSFPIVRFIASLQKRELIFNIIAECDLFRGQWGYSTLAMHALGVKMFLHMVLQGYCQLGLCLLSFQIWNDKFQYLAGSLAQHNPFPRISPKTTIPRNATMLVQHLATKLFSDPIQGSLVGARNLYGQHVSRRHLAVHRFSLPYGDATFSVEVSGYISGVSGCHA